MTTEINNATTNETAATETPVTAATEAATAAETTSTPVTNPAVPDLVLHPSSSPLDSIIWVDLRNITYRAINPNYQTETEFSVIKNSLRQFGWLTPITVCRNPAWDGSTWVTGDNDDTTVDIPPLMLIDGAHRLSAYTELLDQIKAAKENGNSIRITRETKALTFTTLVPVVVIDINHFTPAQQEFLMRAMNTSGAEDFSTLAQIQNMMSDNSRKTLATLGIKQKGIAVSEDKLRLIEEVIGELKDYAADKPKDDEANTDKANTNTNTNTDTETTNKDDNNNETTNDKHEATDDENAE